MSPLRPNRALSLVVAFVAGAAVTATTTGIALSDPGGAMHGHRTTDTGPARDVITRLAPRYAGQFELRTLPSQVDGDTFEISVGRGRIVLSGSSTVALTSAFDHYLRHVAHGQLSWSGDQLDLGQVLPAPASPIRLRTPYKHRYIYNFTQFGYTSPYWDWPRWQREIDLLAAKGMNLVLLPVGQEIVWYDTFREFGYTDEEIRKWIVLPAHQPWQWMSNMSAFGGPISFDLMRRRAELGRQIVDRMRSLGMTPVLPGFSGLVPSGFADRNPGAKVVPQGDWVGFDRPDWLDPATPMYQRIAKAFYQHQKQRFGTTGAYAVDILHEGGQQGDVDIPAAAKGIEQAMRAADPDSIWVVQAWQTNPRRELVEAVDKSKLQVLDINADNDPRWSRTDAFWDAPWAWGILQNGGGRNGMYGNLTEIAKTLPAVWNSGQRGNLNAIAVAMEGTDQNPVVLDLMADMIWRTTPIDLDPWITEYAHARYGKADPDAAQAWEVLLRTAYGTRADNIAGVMGAAESLATARPSLTATTASTWGPQRIRHDPDLLTEAWRLLLRAGPQHSDTYKYDLVDVTRQVIADRTRRLLPRIREAYAAKNRTEFRGRSAEFLALIDAAESILSTRTEFMLGPWLERAKSWGGNATERAQLEWDARSILTVWGHRRASDEGGLHDYANREWAGLMADFYRPRWEKYFASLDAALVEGREPTAVDWFAWEDEWSRQANLFPVKAKGDPYQTSSRIAAQLLTPQVIATPESLTTTAGQQVEIETRFANWYRVPLSGLQLNLDVPAGWRAEPLGSTSFRIVRPMDAVATKWRVTVPSRVGWGTHRLTAHGRHWRGTATDEVSVNIQPVPGQITPPYTTHETTESQYAQSGTGKFAIWAGGRDLSGWTDEKGVILRRDSFDQRSEVSVQVLSQIGSGPNAKAGIAVANDLTAPERGGYAVLVMTTQYGPEFMWDGNGDGKLDGWAGGGASFRPAWLKLTRSGTTYTALTSPDGVTWQQIDSAQVPTAAGTGDAGMVASAVNLNYPGQITHAVFDEFSVTPQ